MHECIRPSGAKTAYITRGSSWESRFIESFGAGPARDELLAGEIIFSPKEPWIIIESCPYRR